MPRETPPPARPGLPSTALEDAERYTIARAAWAAELKAARRAGYVEGLGDGLVEGWDEAMDAVRSLQIRQPERVFLNRQRRDLRRVQALTSGREDAA